MIKINLFNRDGAKLALISKDEKEWKFVVDDEHKYVLEYARIGYASDNEKIEFVDPSGGPMLTLGTTLFDGRYIIDDIEDTKDDIIIRTFNCF